MKNNKKTLLIISWILFGITTSFIIVESCIPSDKSGEQSQFFSRISANIINFFSRPKKVVTTNPISLSIKCEDPSAVIDGNKTSLISEDEAVIGATKLYTYELSYSDTNADIFNSEVNFSCVSSPGDDSYTFSITTGNENGTIRIIPLIEGEYSFKIKDKANHSKNISFYAKERIKSNEIFSNITEISLDIGEYKYFPFSFSFGDLNRSDTTVDHYLQRFYNRSLTQFASSNESIFEVLDGGLIKGVHDGTASLLFNGKSICNINVTNNAFMSEVDHITLSSGNTNISPLDFDYLYGSQIDVHYYNYLNEEIITNEPIRFVSDNALVAMVDNDHLEAVGNELTFVKGGFVSGYRKYGKTYIRAYLCSDENKTSLLEFESKIVNPESATIIAKINQNTLSPTIINQLVSGSTITLSKSYLPKNASNTELRVEVSDNSILEIQNNNTNNPSINILKAGTCSFSVYMPSIGNENKTTYKLSISNSKVIKDKDMNNFHKIIRKGAGHFILFFVNGVFGFIAFCLSFFRNKKQWLHVLINMSLLFATGIVLAGLSELIQTIPALQRGASSIDVLIDFLGFALAVSLCAIIKLVICLIRKKQKDG